VGSFAGPRLRRIFSLEDHLKSRTGLIRSTLGAFALAALLVAPLGCGGVDESGELVGEAAEALNTPVLVATPSPVAFGTITHGTTSTLSVTLRNTGDATASSITLAVPPDPYRAAHNPPGYLNTSTASNVMQITFAPRTTGSFSNTIVVTYRGPSGAGLGTLYTLNIPVTGTAN
jgi:hypothetical protein